jgi:hypothetical protein
LPLFQKYDFRLGRERSLRVNSRIAPISIFYSFLFILWQLYQMNDVDFISFHKMRWHDMTWHDMTWHEMIYFFSIHSNVTFPKLSKNCFGIIFQYIVGYWMSFHESFSSLHFISFQFISVQFNSIQFMKWFCLWFDRIASKYDTIHDIKWYCILLYFIVFYFIVLYCILLYCIALHCIRLYPIELDWIIAQSITQQNNLGIYVFRWSSYF